MKKMALILALLSLLCCVPQAHAAAEGDAVADEPRGNALAAADANGGYSGQVLAMISRQWTPPPDILNRRVAVRLRIDGDGNLLHCDLMTRSDMPEMNRAACAAAKEAGNFGVPPYGMPIEVYVTFWTGKPSKNTLGGKPVEDKPAAPRQILVPKPETPASSAPPAPAPTPAPQGRKVEPTPATPQVQMPKSEASASAPPAPQGRRVEPTPGTPQIQMPKLVAPTPQGRKVEPVSPTPAPPAPQGRKVEPVPPTPTPPAPQGRKVEPVPQEKSTPVGKTETPAKAPAKGAVLAPVKIAPPAPAKTPTTPPATKSDAQAPAPARASTQAPASVKTTPDSRGGMSGDKDAATTPIRSSDNKPAPKADSARKETPPKESAKKEAAPKASASKESASKVSGSKESAPKESVKKGSAKAEKPGIRTDFAPYRDPRAKPEGEKPVPLSSEQRRYAADVTALIQARIVPPAKLPSGKYTVAVTVDVGGTGDISEAEVARSSGQAVLDETVLRTILRLEKVTPPPDKHARDLKLTLTVHKP